MAVGKPLHLRLFLEGEEVPVIAAQVSINTSAPATASIQIIPLDSGLNLLPRTMVHLFFLDARVDTSIGPRQEGQSDYSGTYRLLFSGEFVGFSWQQTPASRALILQCIDFSNYWDSANVMAISYGPGGNAFTNQGGVNGASLGTLTDIPGDSAAEKLVRWISARPVTEGLKGISGLAGGVIHVLEAMGGVPGHFKGVNDFFTIAELRCRLLNQITAEENDTAASRVLSINVFNEWLKNGIEQAGGNISFRDVMKLLFQYIYYEFVPNPAPKYDESATTEKTKVSYKISTHPVAQSAKAIVEKVAKDLLSNREGFGGTGLQLNAASGAEADMNPRGMLTAKIWRKTVKNYVEKLKVALNKLEPIASQVNDAYVLIAEASVILTSWANRPPDADDRLVLVSESRPKVVYDQAQNLLKAVELLSTSGKTALSSVSAKNSAARLRTQIIRPDCWFSSPPACNVIFPEMYAQVSYDRNFLQETTRLLVATFNTLVGRDHLLANHVLSPYIGLDAEKLAKYKGSKSFRILMDHEIHVGIIPKQEWIPNTAGISNSRNSLNSEQMKKVKDGRLSWIIKASLFHFFKYRFAARQVSVSGRFNPFLVCGFPGAVITRPYIIKGGAEELRQKHGSPVPDSEINAVIHEKADELGAPSHFVGMIGAIQHSVDQSGGTTNAVLHHARKHRGIDDEFIGVLAKTNEGRAKRVIKVILDVDTAQDLARQKNPNAKPLQLLVGVTPQVVETQPKSKSADKPVKLAAVEKSTQTRKVDPTAADIRKAIQEGLSPLGVKTDEQKLDDEFQSTFGSTQVQEQDSNQEQAEPSKLPERVKTGSIPGINREGVWVPHGSTKVKVNEKKGLYGGKIIGIEVLNAHTVSVSYLTTTKSKEYARISEDAEVSSMLNQFQGSPAGDQYASLVASLISKPLTVTKTSKSDGVAFSMVAIYEEVDFAVTGTLPIEELLRPSWFSTSYANANIGSKIYMPFFGCGAVVDGLSVSGTQSVGVEDSADSEPVDAATSAGDLTKRLSSEEDAKRANSIEKALNLLGYEYGQVKTQGMDVDTFIRDYTNRPIATHRDIFGDADLHFTIDRTAVGGAVKVKKIERDGVEVTPKVGFHTGATHPELVGTVENGGKLIGLTTDIELGYKRAGGIGKDDPLVTQYDVRPAKKARVVEYLTELGKGPGFLG